MTGEVPLILVLYVDDLFLTGDERLIGDYKSTLAVEFEMKDLGLMHYFLGFKVWQREVWTREVCSGDLEEIQDGGFQSHVHTSSFQLKED